jgi:hypothetical protein
MTLMERVSWWMTPRDARDVIEAAEAWARTWDADDPQSQVQSGFRLLEAIDRYERRRR